MENIWIFDTHSQTASMGYESKAKHLLDQLLGIKYQKNYFTISFHALNQYVTNILPSSKDFTERIFNWHQLQNRCFEALISRVLLLNYWPAYTCNE